MTASPRGKPWGAAAPEVFLTCSNSPTKRWGCFVILASALDVEILVHDLLDGLVVVGDVGVAVDGVLDDGGGHGEVHHVHGLVAAHHGVNQAGSEGITAAHTIQNVEGEELALEGVALIPHVGLQGVLGAGVGIAHMAGDALDVGVALDEVLSFSNS